MPDNSPSQNASLPDDQQPSIADLRAFLSGPLDIRSLALSGLFLLALFYTLYVARAVFLPLILALLLSFLLAPLVHSLTQLRLPAALGAALVLLAFLGLVGVGIYGLSAPAAMVALFSFEDVGRALWVPVVFIVLTGLEGLLITPTIVGRRLTLNPVVIFIWLTFWGWMWGIAGALLAVPMLATLKILCDHVKPLTPIGEFLGN